MDIKLLNDQGGFRPWPLCGGNPDSVMDNINDIFLIIEMIWHNNLSFQRERPENSDRLWNFLPAFWGDPIFL